MEAKQKAKMLLRRFKGEDYAYGLGVLEKIGTYAAAFGKRALVIANTNSLKPVVDEVLLSLERHGVKLAGGAVIAASRPNSPKEDVYRIAGKIVELDPASLVVIGGGSSIDAAKAANLLAVLDQDEFDIEPYFGTGLVSAALEQTGKGLWPLIAVQTVAGSGAHLTKYSNVTDSAVGQKKLIVDDALVPARAIFDYKVTATTPRDLTIDGALDTIAHCIEVFYGSGETEYALLRDITTTALELVLKFTKEALKNPKATTAREALGLASDLGGCAIMLGGTNGAHLTSFSLVDVTSHGRACGIMNPYYTIFFSPAIERQLREVGVILQKTGFLARKIDGLKGRELGTAVAQGLVDFSKSINSPTTLDELPGFNEGHITRALAAAKDPQLDMKLRNMPVSLSADLVNAYMKPILLAAKTGDFSLIKNMGSSLVSED